MITTREFYYIAENWKGYLSRYKWGIQTKLEIKKTPEMLLAECRNIPFTCILSEYVPENEDTITEMKALECVTDISFLIGYNCPHEYMDNISFDTKYVISRINNIFITQIRLYNLED